jgi:hypothetical protein
MFIVLKWRTRLATRGGESEWELIKILSQKNSAYIPIATPRVTHEQVEAHTNLSQDLRNKAWKARKQSGSKHERTRATTKKAETYRVNRHKWPGHPEPYRAAPGHPGTSDQVNLSPSGHPAQVTGLSYGPPWAHYLGGYQERLLGGPLGLLGLRHTAPNGVGRKVYGGEVLG